MEETRPVPQEINVNSLLTKNSVLQIEQGDLLKRRKFKYVHLKTARVSMLSRLMTEQGDLLLRQLQYKTTLKYIMKPTRSTLMMKYFVKEMEKSIVVHDENHEPMMVNEADMDFRIPGLPHSVVKRAKYQRSTIDSEN